LLISPPGQRATATALSNTQYSMGSIVAAWLTFGTSPALPFHLHLTSQEPSASTPPGPGESLPYSRPFPRYSKLSGSSSSPNHHAGSSLKAAKKLPWMSSPNTTPMATAKMRWSSSNSVRLLAQLSSRWRRNRRNGVVSGGPQGINGGFLLWFGLGSVSNGVGMGL
jgi:hypothetical protein